MTVAADQRYCL
jgi:hypothetical protein